MSKMIKIDHKALRYYEKVTGKRYRVKSKKPFEWYKKEEGYCKPTDEIPFRHKKKTFTTPG